MLTYIFVIAITAEAMSGALAAGRRNMDLFGVALIAFMTALGGGTVRDMLLGNYPVTWTQHPLYIYMTSAPDCSPLSSPNTCAGLTGCSCWLTAWAWWHLPSSAATWL